MFEYVFPLSARPASRYIRPQCSERSLLCFLCWGPIFRKSVKPVDGWALRTHHDKAGKYRGRQTVDTVPWQDGSQVFLPSCAETVLFNEILVLTKLCRYITICNIFNICVTIV